MSAVTAEQVRTALDPARLSELLTRLRLREEDRAAVLHHAAHLDDHDLGQVAAAATAVSAQLGNWGESQRPVFDPWPDLPGRPRGLIPMLALLATVPRVRRYHADRGISAEVTHGALGDLGQQLWVYRQTFGHFGLDNTQWLTTAWSGALFWLGRLQANLRPYAHGHVISVHIPQTGPLTPVSVDDSLSRARAFFTAHFPEAPAHALHCDSWLLDPQLAQVLPAESNIVRFQRRWRLVDQPREADAAIVYFVFAYRPPPGARPDYRHLPRDTRLRRAVLEHLEAGGHWYARTGLIDLPPPARH